MLSGNTGMGMDVKPLTADEMFALDWADNHASEPPKCPRFSRATNRGLEYVKTDQLRSASNVYPVHPRAGRG